MLKATQAKSQSLTKLVFDDQTCHVCGKAAKPWGIILHGAKFVCSKTCHDHFTANRWRKP